VPLCPNWIQRSVTINVTTAGYYWLSFAADGTNDSYGGQLDNILLCRVSCSGTVQDNYTTAWAASSLLFEDNFESPHYSGPNYNTNGNVNNSDGSSSYWDVSGNGWSNAPTNQLPYWVSGCPQGNQCVELGWNSNSLIGQSFVLVPGYYQIKYNYVSEVLFATLGSTVYCGSTPSAANISTLTAASSTGSTGFSAPTTEPQERHQHRRGVHVACPGGEYAQQRHAMGTTTSYTNPTARPRTRQPLRPTHQSDQLQCIASQSVARHLRLCVLGATRTAVVSSRNRLSIG